jgi:hypothetical protein
VKVGDLEPIGINDPGGVNNPKLHILLQKTLPFYKRLLIFSYLLHACIMSLEFNEIHDSDEDDGLDREYISIMIVFA